MPQRAIIVLSANPPAESPEAVFERRRLKLEELNRLYGRPLLNYLFGLTRNWHDAEDLLSRLLQFTLLNVPEEKMLHFGLLRKKAWQLAMDHFRSVRRRRETYPGEVPEVAEESVHETGGSAEEETELQARFWDEHPVELTEGQRTALWLHAREGRTCAEIGLRLNVPQSTVHDWIKLARTRLAEHLGRA